MKQKTKSWISRHAARKLGTSLLGNVLTGKEVKWSNIPGRRVIPTVGGTIETGEGTIIAG